MYGIDLGTTNSVIAIVDKENGPIVIGNKEGGRLTPSAVGFYDGENIVGENAKKKHIISPNDVVLSIKREMGNNIKIKVNDQEYFPEEISAKILRKLVDDANDKLNKNINDVIITVPAYFNDKQRKATKKAGEIAGLNVLRVINEPTAAALAYGLDKRDVRSVCIYDLGGGTFDVSILTIGEGVCEVNATAGNTSLGGDDFDKKIQEWIIDKFQRETGIDLSEDVSLYGRVRSAAEDAKKQLSTSSQAEITLPFITQKDGEALHINYKLTQKEFAAMIEDLIKKTIECLNQAVSDSQIPKNEISEVILVGGSTRVPMVQDAISSFFGKTPNKTVNPDEVVAIGAAINAGIIAGVIDNVILADVTPLTLSIEVHGGLAEPMIIRNTTIPTTHKQIFTTLENGQTDVDVHIVQGERAMASDNLSLGRFKLDGIIPAPAGDPKVEVSFTIDVNGILSVSAKDLLTDKEASITIESSESLDENTLEKIVSEGKEHAEEDKFKRRLIEARNITERLIEQAYSILNDNKTKISDEEVIRKVEESIKNAQNNIDVDNPDVIEKSFEALKEDMLLIGKVMYTNEK